MKQALIVFISGAVICFGSFIFALINMGVGAYRTIEGGIESFAFMFAGHLGAMAGLALGSLVSMIGVALFIYEIAKQFRK